MNSTLDYNQTTEGWMENFTTVRPRPRGVAPTVGPYGYARETLWKVVPPIIISWGTIGNILTILVILRQVKRSSTSVYLMALAVSDLGILYSGPLRNWIKFMWDKDIRYMTDVGCKLQLYVTYVSVHFSSWLLVLVTWERALSVLLPHKVKICCTTRRAGVITFVLLVIILGVDSFMAISSTLYGVDGLRCSPSTAAYRDFRDLYWHWIDFGVVYAVPFVLLLVGNTIIIVQLRRSRHMKQSMRASAGGSNKSDDDGTRSVSYLMVALCVIYFLTMTPVTSYQIYLPYALNAVLKLNRTDGVNAYKKYEFHLFLHAVFYLIGYTNATLNFMLYVFSGSKFRGELLGLFPCIKKALERRAASASSKSSGLKTTKTSAKSSGKAYLSKKA